jgi:hypothetical protein
MKSQPELYDNRSRWKHKPLEVTPMKLMGKK